MRSRYLFAVMFVMVTSAAHAWDCNDAANRSLNVPGNECYTGNASPAPSGQSQAQGQRQGQAQGQGQQQSATGGKGGSGGQGGLGGAGGDAQGGSSQATGGAGGNASATGSQQSQSADNAGNSQSTAYTSPRQPVMTAVAGFGETTAKCRYTNGAGVQTFPAGVAFGFSFKDKDCERIALSNLFYSRGQSSAGDRLICSVVSVRSALGDDCLALVNQLQPKPVPPPTVDIPPVMRTPPTDYVTKEELDLAIRKGLTK